MKFEKSSKIKKYKASYWDFKNFYKNKYVDGPLRKFHHNRIAEDHKWGTLGKAASFFEL